jgi:hypothetical protein
MSAQPSSLNSGASDHAWRYSGAFVGTLEQLEEIVEFGPVFFGERELAVLSRANVLGIQVSDEQTSEMRTLLTLSKSSNLSRQFSQ